MGEVSTEFPLFPLGLVALPGEVVPLHIFEERYKTMIGECLERDAEFGIVWLSDDGLHDVGCSCEVAEVLERMPDGRMNVACRGTRPFRVVERVEYLAYPAGTVEWLDDVPEVVDQDALAGAHDAYSALVEEVTDEPADAGQLLAMDAYDMAATVDFGLDAKQGLLELRSENARLRFMTRLLLAAMKRLDFVERAQARARSNGRVRFG